jgi:hypothetical protein
MTALKRRSIKDFNDWLGLKITNAIGTMWCAYIFTALAFISLPAALNTHDPIIIISWIAQTFLQLVLLSVIMVGQRLMAESHTELHNKHDQLSKQISEVHAQIVANKK